jgi:hypothetical protein
MDMATVMGTDLNSNILQIGKALNDPIKGITALNRAGVQFTDQQKDQIAALQESGRTMEAQKMILAELESQFGGAAEAMAKDFNGGLIQAGNAMGDLKEEMGFVITKNEFFIQLTQLAKDQFAEWTEKIKENREELMLMAKSGAISVVEAFKVMAAAAKFFEKSLSAVRITFGSMVQLAAKAQIEWYETMIHNLEHFSTRMENGVVSVNIERQQQVSAQLQEYKNKLSEANATLKAANLMIEGNSEKIMENEKQYADLESSIDGFLSKMKDLPATAAEAADGIGGLGNNLDGTKGEIDETAQAAWELAAALNAIKYNEEAIQESWHDYITEMNRQIAREKAAYEKLQKDKSKADEAATKAMAKAHDKAVEEMERNYERLYDNIHDVNAQLWRDLITDGGNAFDILKDKALDVFAQIAATWSTGLVMNVITGGQGAAGMPFSGSQAGTGLLSNLSSLKSIYGIGSTYANYGMAGLSNTYLGTSYAGLSASGGVGAAGGAYAGPGINAAQVGSYTAGSGASTAAGGMSAAGLATAGFWAAFAAVGLKIIGEMTKDSPSIAMGYHAPGDPSAHTPQGGWAYGSKSNLFDYRVGVKDTDQDPQVQSAVFDYFDALFTGIEETVGLSMQDVLERHGKFSTGVSLGDGQTINDLSNQVFSELLGSMISELFSGAGTVMEDYQFQTGYKKTTGGGRDGGGTIYKPVYESLQREISVMAEYFNEEFFKAITPEGGSQWDAFTQFAGVVENTEDFLAQFTRQMDEFGETAVSAYGNIQAIDTVMSAIGADTAAVSTVSDFTEQIDSLSATFDEMIAVLESAHATVESINEAEKARAQILGAQITGLSASSIQSALVSGGGIDAVMQKTMTQAMAGVAAEAITERYILPINEAAGRVWIESGGDMMAVINAIQSMDMSGAQAEVSAFERAVEAAFGPAGEVATASVGIDRLAASTERLAASTQALESLQIQYHNLIGNTGAANEITRQSRVFEIKDEFGDLAGPVVELQRRIWGLEDAMDASARANEALEDATYAADAAKSAYIDGLRAEVRVLEDNLSKAKSQYLQLLNDELQALKDNLNSAKSEYLDLLKSEVSEQERTSAALSAAAKTLRKFRQDLYFDDMSGMSGSDSKDMAWQAVLKLSDRAMGGDTESFSDLTGALGRFVDISKATAGSWLEFDRDMAMAARMSTQMAIEAESQVTEAQEQINLLNDVIAAVQEVSSDVKNLDQARALYEQAKHSLDISEYQTQIDLLTGANELASDIADAEMQYQEAKTALETSWHAAELTVLEGIEIGILELKGEYEDMSERQAAAQAAADQAAADQAEASRLAAEALAAAQAAAAAQAEALAAEQRKQAALSNMDLYAAAKTEQVHREIQNLNPEYIQMFPGGYPSVNEVKNALLQGGFTPMSHWQAYGQYEDLQFAKGGIADGPKSGYTATLHGTEAVIPLETGSVPVRISGQSNREVVEELRGLRAEVNALRRESADHSESIARHTSDTAWTVARWERGGTPPAREAI